MENIFDYTPISFAIMIPEGRYQTIDNFLAKFVHCFNVLDQTKKVNLQSLPFQLVIHQSMTNSIRDCPTNKAILQRESSLRLTMPQCHFTGGNYWVLKTTHQNRGIGIYVFKTMAQLRKIMNGYVLYHERESEEQKIVQVSKSLQFIVQKYIERPFLIARRKFDIRVWVLVNQDFEVFFFKEGYLRTSTCEYKLDDCQNQLVHLTNNAVQKNGKGYGKFEDGNMLGFDDFQKIIDEQAEKEKKPKVSVHNDLVPDMKFIVTKTIDSVKNKLNAKRRKGCFELFGYDFMVDKDLTVWLIECNSNPCLDESSLLLQKLIPRLIDDTFRLTIDKEFPSPLEDKLKQLKAIRKSNYTRYIDESPAKRFGLRKINSGIDVN